MTTGLISRTVNISSTLYKKDIVFRLVFFHIMISNTNMVFNIYIKLFYTRINLCHQFVRRSMYIIIILVLGIWPYTNAAYDSASIWDFQRMVKHQFHADCYFRSPNANCIILYCCFKVLVRDWNCIHVSN